MNLPKGWGKSPASRKWHYFDDDSFSLCRKIGFFFGETEQDNDDHSDNCAECKKKKKALDERRAKESS